MKLRLVAAALLALSISSATIGAATPKNPLDREWLFLVTGDNGYAIGVDPKSFKVIKPREEFSFDSITVFSKSMMVPPGMVRPDAQVSTVLAKCDKHQAQVIADTLHDATGKVIGTNEAAKIDKMSPVDPTSIAGKIVESICTGKSLAGKPEPKRGDDIHGA